MVQPGPEWTLYYDGGCNLCHTSKLRAEHWAERAGQPFRALPLASDEGVAKGLSDTMTLETPEGTFAAADAWLEIMRLAPWPLRAMSWMRLASPTRSLARWVYGIVAKYRLRLFGARTCAVHGRTPVAPATRPTEPRAACPGDATPPL